MPGPCLSRDREGHQEKCCFRGYLVEQGAGKRMQDPRKNKRKQGPQWMGLEGSVRAVRSRPRARNENTDTGF